jgi:predicted ribosomally synthesized peptide with nif11-like leader
MSKENLEQFMNQIADSEELQAKIGEQIDAAALIALGAECGCEFTAEELQEAAELSDEELEGVAGGVRIGNLGWQFLARALAHCPHRC